MFLRYFLDSYLSINHIYRSYLLTHPSLDLILTVDLFLTIQMKQAKITRLIILFFVISLSFYLFKSHQHQVQGAAMSDVKNTLSSAQLSYFGRLDFGSTLSTTILVGNSGPSSGSINLFVGQTLAIGRATADTRLDNYTIRDLPTTGSIGLNSSIGGSNSVPLSAVIATSSAIHTVKFTPVTHLTNSKFQVLIKASGTAPSTKYNDGIPDQDGFDIGQTTASVTTGPGTRLTTNDVFCSGTNIGTTATSIGTTTISSVNYHYFECSINTGTSNALASYTITIGSTLAGYAVNHQLSNPAPGVGHITGTAGSPVATGIDIYSFAVKHFDASNVLADQTQGKIALTEAVRVTATVDPTITFIIDNQLGTTGPAIAVGNTICGVPMGTNQGSVTGASVPFGSLGLSQFNNLAQRISCVTNSASGYSVTVGKVDYMHIINTDTTLPDTKCDTQTCTAVAPAIWSTDVGNTNSGYGYSLQNINATNVGTTFISAANWQARPFANLSTGGTGVQIMWNSSTPSVTERAYVCYRIAINTLQTPGDYENEVNYVATATF